MAKKTHEKELWEYHKDDHYNMALWHLRRCGISPKVFEELTKLITDSREEYIEQIKKIIESHMKPSLKQKQAKFLHETVTHFNSTNRGVDFSSEVPYGFMEYKCSYEAGCAIGRKVGKKLGKQLDEVRISEAPLPRIQLPIEIFDKLPKYLRELGNTFLRQIQILHDTAHNWDEKGLTELGKQYLSTIIYDHIIQKEYEEIKSNNNTGSH